MENGISNNKIYASRGLRLCVMSAAANNGNVNAIYIIGVFRDKMQEAPAANNGNVNAIYHWRVPRQNAGGPQPFET